MGSQTLSILRQGIWASLTGGWYYDPKLPHFINVFHLYLWLLFLLFPFIVHLSSSSFFSWLAYCLTIGSLFTTIKLINWYLHHLFDHGEFVVEETSSHKSDDEINIEDKNESHICGHHHEETSPSIMNVNENPREHIEMMVMSDRSLQKNTSDEREEDNNSKKITSVKEDSTLETTEMKIAMGEVNYLLPSSSANISSVIDLEVDVHHRNSSGSSIGGTSSERTKSHTGNGDQSAKIDNCSQSPVDELQSHEKHKSAINVSCEPLTKVTSLEMGFMSQDPSVKRAANAAAGSACGSNEQQMKGKRGEIHNIVRRARSELETAQCSSNEMKNMMSSLPPSHPVSLETIGTSVNQDMMEQEETTSRDRKKSQKSSDFRRTTASLGENIKPIEELNVDDNIDNLIHNPSSTSIFNSTKSQITSESEEMLSSQSHSENRSQSDLKRDESTEASGSANVRSTDDEGDESDVSLVSDNPVKVKKKKTPKNAKRKTLSRRRVSKSTSNCKIQSLNRKSSEKSDNLELNKRNAIRYSSDSDIESSDHASDLYSSVSVSPCSSDSSINEKTPLATTLSLPSASTQDRTDKDKGATALEARCVAGPSKSSTYDELGKKIFDIISKNDPSECEMELKRIRNELQNKRRAVKTRSGGSHGSHRSREHSELHEQLSSGAVSTFDASIAANSGSTENAPQGPHGPHGPPPYLLARILSVPGTHLASTHEDTTVGSIHVFQDEQGNWLTYTFDENSMGIAKGLMNNDKQLLDFETYSFLHRQSLDTSSSGSTVVLDTPGFIHTPKFTSQTHEYSRLALQPNASSLFADSFPITSISRLRTNRRFELSPNILFNHQSVNNLNGANMNDLYPMRFGDFSSPDPQPNKPKQYYKLWVFPFKYIKVRFDRLKLLALLDRSLTTFELTASIILAILVAALGSIILYKQFFQDIWLFIFCFVMASSHYTLIKSVQPDSSSPTHGYNRITLFSRPIYFCISSSILLLSQQYLEKTNHNLSFKIYGIDLLSDQVFETIRSANILFLLSFPIIFSFGMLPQITTFIMYIFEQIDVHLLGGTAVTGLISSMYGIIRSIFSIALLYLFALIAFQSSTYTQNVTFSVFCGLLVATCYHLSRGSSDPGVYWRLMSRCFKCKTSKKKFCQLNIEKQVGDQENTSEDETEDSKDQEICDPLPAKLDQTVLIRLQSDLIVCIFIVIVIFAIHVSTIFTLQPYVEMSLSGLAMFWGFTLHYIFNHFRKQLPWMCFANPVFRPKEYNQFEVKGPARLMWFEKLYTWFWLIEKNVIYPLFFLSAITNDAPILINKFGLHTGTFITVLCGFKCIRTSYNDSSSNYILLLFTYLFFKFDLSLIAEPFLLNYYILSIAYFKFYELLLKVRFIVTYVAPWQITWGSAFHAFAQPFSVPHSAMLFTQAIVSSIISAPLQPVLGSAIFFASYVRPIKFWERDYNTKRVDHSNIRLASQLERAQLGADDNNLNSIFYEHLTRSLQHTLYGDLMLGRWGAVSQGDCFVLASDNLNCLVHIIELGNGLVTFQVRGLEFRGTYCQQREVEAISEGVSEDEGCCCCEPGHLPGMLAINAAFNQRWLAWEVTHTKYVLEGYSITDNSANTMLQAYDLRKALITYYIKSIIYFCVTSKSLEKWIEQKEIRETLESMNNPNYVDLDPTFNASVDEDFDFRLSGITRSSFCTIYLEWIQYCIEHRNSVIKIEMEMNSDKENLIISLCFSLSLLARRALSAASHHNSFTSVEFLLFGLHSLFKGDFRITSSRDEWVFQDMNLFRKVIVPSVRMSLKLHQDHFMSTDEYDDNPTLFDAISNYTQNLIISHEADPIWRNAVLSNVPSLLALRHVFDDGSDLYKIIMLNKRYLSFRVIKINRECVRGLWAGQQLELVYLRNRNPERGSIQNAKQALRNIINSSCDQPIGYPIYVSPLTTSFAETNEQLSKVIGPSISFGMFKRAFTRCWQRIRTRCGEGCSSGASAIQQDVCGRIETFERGSTRGSNFSENSADLDSGQFLYRRNRNQASIPYAYRRQFRYPENKGNTLINLTAIRQVQVQVPTPSTPSVNAENVEMDNLLLHKTIRTKAELV